MVKPKFIVLSLLGAFVILGLCYFFYNDAIDFGKGPCPLTDTIDLTGSKRFPNGSFLYEGLIIPRNLTRSYKFKPDDYSKWIKAKPHVRGCVCKLRPCVKFCCPLSKTDSQENCEDLDRNISSSSVMDITTSNGEIRKGDVTKEFSIQYGRTCPAMFYLDVELISTDAFSLFENGTLLILESKVYLSKEQFCLSYNFEETETYQLTPMNCSGMYYEKIETKANVSAITMLISVAFFILIIFVYMAIPDLRTLHGKALCCYLTGLSFAYLITSAVILAGPKYIENNTLCKILGFSGYFSYMFSFCWLSVISFDLYYKIRGMHETYDAKQRFILYSIYAWGLAFVLLCLTYAADMSSFIPDPWKPSINLESRCWFNGITGWSAMIYVFVPIIVIITFCIVMFILTARLIYGIQNEMSRMTNNNRDYKKNLRSDREKFGVFLRLFIISGVTWSLEIIPYLMGTEHSWIALQYITDFVNSIQGLLIFVLFVLKKKVKQQIIKRFFSNHLSEPNSQNLNKTQASNANIALSDIAVQKPEADKLIPEQN